MIRSKNLEQMIHTVKEKMPDLIVKSHQPAGLFDDEMWSGAVLSNEDPAIYRYLLWRIWNESLPCLTVIMLNPSEADENFNDRTIKTLIALCNGNGYGGFIVVNLFAWRDKEPAQMKLAEYPIGDRNEEILEISINESNDILCAWGVHGNHLSRDKDVICKLIASQKNLLAIKVSKNGMPEHPLYKSFSDKFQQWQPSTTAI